MTEFISSYIENRRTGNKLANQTRSGFERLLHWRFSNRSGAHFHNQLVGAGFQPFDLSDAPEPAAGHSPKTGANCPTIPTTSQPHHRRPEKIRGAVATTGQPKPFLAGC